MALLTTIKHEPKDGSSQPADMASIFKDLVSPSGDPEKYVYRNVDCGSTSKSVQVSRCGIFERNQARKAGRARSAPFLVGSFPNIGAMDCREVR